MQERYLKPSVLDSGRNMHPSVENYYCKCASNEYESIIGRVMNVNEKKNVIKEDTEW